MKLNVHLLDTPSDSAFDVLRTHVDADVILTSGRDLPPEPGYHILVAGRPERAHLDSSSVIQKLIIPFAGMPPTTRNLMRDFPHIDVYNLHHNAPRTAEMAMALLLAAAKFIIPYDRTLRNHDWTPRYRPNPSMLLEGKTALVLGFGAIGSRIARACWGLGMQVLATRRTSVPNENLGFPVEIHTPQTLPSLLPRACVVVIALPATPATDGLIGARELAFLPRGSVLVNIGRGPIVDQHALYDALNSGQLAAAGLDVWYNYPTDEASRTHTPPADVPFHELENIVMSPHRGGASDETEPLRMRALADLINAAARGDPLPNRVDVEAGY